MAVFLLNICKFNDCGLTFQNLVDLIQHIEDNHIDYDPLVIKEKEQQRPPCLPLSYVLRFFTDAARTLKPQARPPEILPPPIITPLASDGDDDDIRSESEDSNDSWSTQEEYSAEFIMKYGSKKISGLVRAVALVFEDDEDDYFTIRRPRWIRQRTDDFNMLDDIDFSTRYRLSKSSVLSVLEQIKGGLEYDSDRMTSPGVLPDGTPIEKPFACPVPGCKKRYKNVNGIKYHSKNGHKNEGKIRKGFKCYCGKSYKTNGGLRNHTALMHSGTTMTTIATQNGTPQVLQIPTLQPIRTLTLKHIASLGLPIKTLVVATKGDSPTTSLGVLTPATSPTKSDDHNYVP